MIKLLCELEAIMACDHPANFGDHRDCGSGEMVFLVCQVILKGPAIKGLYDFTGMRLSRSVTILLSLVATDTLVVEM